MAVGCGVLFDRNGTGGWGNSPGWWSVLTHHGPGFFGRDISNIQAGRIRGGQNGKKRDVLIERVVGFVDDVLGNEGSVPWTRCPSGSIVPFLPD